LISVDDRLSAHTAAPVEQNTMRRRGVGLRAIDPDRAFRGFTLFAPITGSGQVYLIDLDGNVIHQWNLPYPPGAYGYLLPNGNLFYNGKTRENIEGIPWWFKGGIMLEADPSGNIVWEYRHPDHHHDARRLANGNTIVLATEPVPRALAARVKGGLPGSELNGGGILADVVYEVTPAGTIVWTWHAYEHLDPDTDILTSHDKREEWTHANSVGELADGNLILSFRNLSTVVIVERATGEIIWRLGRETLANQHYPHELANGNILIFDNGTYRQNVALNYSRVIEVERSTKTIVWEYTDTPPHNFFSPYISGAQRLPNGNTLITEGNYGRLFEVTAGKQIVWEYVNPHFGLQQVTADRSPAVQGQQNSVFRAFRYAPARIPWLKA
jgi:hypothetical protein